MDEVVCYAAEYVGHLPLGGTKTPWRVTRRAGGTETVVGYFPEQEAAKAMAAAYAKEAAASEAVRCTVVLKRAGDPSRTSWVAEYAPR